MPGIELQSGSVGSSGAEIAYAEITTSPAVGTTSASVAGLQIAIPAGTGVYMVECWGLLNVPGGGYIQIDIFDEGGITLATGFHDVANSPSGTPGGDFIIKRRMPATATGKTLAIRAKRTGGTGGSILSGTGSSASLYAGGPTYIQAYGR